MNQNRKKEEDKDEKHRGPKRQRRNPSGIGHVVPDLPTQFNGKIMELLGSDVQLVIQKELNKSDMCPIKKRLSIPDRRMQNDFLNSEERLRLKENEPNRPRSKGLHVPLIDPSFHEWTITVKEVHVHDTYCYYGLGGTWKEVVIANGLEQGNSIQLWSFRVNERPHLLLVKLENEERKQIHSGSSET